MRFALLFIFFLPLGLIAQNDTVPAILTDRPTQAESPYLMPKGFFQVETGVFYTDRTDPVNEINSLSLAATMLRYGVFENFEIRVAGSFEDVAVKIIGSDVDSTYNGMGPVLAGFKVFIVEEKGVRPEMAIVGSVTFRHVGNVNFRPTYSYPTGKLALNHTLSKKFDLGYNIGFSYNGENPDGFFIYSGFLGYKISNVIWSFAEAYGTFDHGNLPNHLLDAGLTFLIIKNLQADISGGFGFDKEVDQYFVSAGLSWRIPR